MDSLGFISVLVIALGLSADCFAVVVGACMAVKSFSLLQILRVSFSFGFFQTLMCLLGWLLGTTVVGLIASFDHWIAFFLLAVVGGRMLWESFHSGEERKDRADITKGWSLLTLSLATSIDSLAVGLSFAFLKVNMIMAGATIGIVAFIITAVAFLVGMRLGKLVGERAEAIGGIVLIGIGIKILLEHIL